MFNSESVNKVFKNIEDDYKTLEQMAMNATDAINKINNQDEKSTYDELKKVLDSLIKYRNADEELNKTLSDFKFDYDDKFFVEMLSNQQVLLDTLYTTFITVQFQNFNTTQEFLAGMLESYEKLKMTLNDNGETLSLGLNELNNRIYSFLEQQKKIMDAIVRNVYKKTNGQYENISLDDDFKISKEESSRRLTSATQQINALARLLDEDSKRLILKGDNVTYQELKETLSIVPELLKTARKKGDIAEYGEGLNYLIEQTSSMTLKTMKLVDDEDYSTIQLYEKNVTKYRKYNELLSNIYKGLNEGKDFEQKLADIESSFDLATDFIKVQIDGYINHQIEKLNNLHGGVKDKDKIIIDNYNDYVLQTSKKQYMPYNNKFENFVQRNLENKNSLFNNVHFHNLYDSYNMNTQSYNTIVSEIHEEEKRISEKTGVDINELFKEDVREGRFAQPLSQNNDSLIELSKGMDKKSIRFGTNVDRKTAEEIRDTIVDAIHRTYKQIQSQSRFDPDSKLLRVLKKQVEELEKEKEELDKVLGSNELKQYHDLFKSITTPLAFFTGALAMLGMGGLFSLSSWKQRVENRANSNGSLMYQNYISNMSMGANSSSGALDRVYNQGENLFQRSYGMIDFSVPTNLYRDLAKSVGGAYGSSPNSGAIDLGLFAKQLTLPTQLYGINNGVISSFINTFYKINREDTRETMILLNVVFDNARKSNVPIEKYMTLTSEMGTKFRQLGHDGKKAIFNIDFMIEDGLRLEDAGSMQGQILGAQENWTRDKSNAFYSVYTGQSGDLFSAMLLNMKTHDSHGNPIGNRQKMVGEQMIAKLGLFANMTDNVAMNKFLFVQEFSGQGYRLKDADRLAEYAANGEAEKLGAYLEGIDEKEAKNKEHLAGSYKDFSRELDATANLLGEKQKNIANMTVSANKIAESLGSHHSAMNKFHDKIQSAIKYFDVHAVEFIKLLGELPDKIKKIQQKMNENPIASAMMQHPILAGLTVLGGTVGGYKLMSNGMRKLGNWNNVESIKTQNKIMNAPKGNLASLKNMLGRGARSLSKIKAGRFGLLFAGAGLLSSLSSNAEAAERQDDFESKSDEENINIFADMLKTGSAKLTIRDDSGKTQDLLGERSFSKWLDENSGIVTALSIGAMLFFSRSRVNLVSKYKITPPPKTKFPNITIPKRTVPLTVAMLASGVAFSSFDELLEEDEEVVSFEDKTKNVLVDTGVAFGTSALLSLIPYIGIPLSIGAPILSGLGGEYYGIDPLSMVSDSVKSYFGLGERNKMALLMKKNIQIDAKSFYETMKKDNEQTQFMKDYFKQNGLDYDTLDEVQKKLLSKMIEDLSLSRLTLGEVLKVSAKGAVITKTNISNNKKRRVTKAAKENLAKQIEEQFSNDNPDAMDWYSAEAKEKYLHNLKEKETETNEDVLKKINSEQNELSGIIGYVKYLHGDASDLVAQTNAELGIDFSDENVGIRMNEYNAKKEEIKTRWSEYYYSWQDELKKHYAWRKEQEYLETKDSWVSEDDDTEPNLNDSEVIEVIENSGIFPQDAINQAKLVSQKTGVPADYILGIFYLESNGAWEISEQMHNYGNTKYAGSKGQDSRGHGIYATMEEGAEALANYSIAFGDLESREILKQAALSNNPRAFVYQMKEKGYFTADVEHYLSMFLTGLGFARGAGVQGVASGISESTISNINKVTSSQPQTLNDMYLDSIKKYQNAIGNVSEKIGSIVNGMFVDTTQDFISIEQKIREIHTERGISQEINSYYERSSKATEEATNHAVAETSFENVRKLEEEQEREKKLVEEESRLIEEQKRTKSNVAHLTIIGKLKKGKSLDELREKVEDIIEEYGITAKTQFKDVAQMVM